MKASKLNKKIIWIILAFSLALTFANYLSFYKETLEGWFLIKNLCIDYLQLVSVFLSLHFVSKAFPIKYNSNTSFFSLGKALFIYWAVGIFIALVLIELEFLFLSYRDTNFYEKDFPIITIYILLITLIYIIGKALLTNKFFRKKYYAARHGNKEELVNVDDIRAIFILKEQIYMLTESKSLLLSQSLEQIEPDLSNEFMRVNRQLIIHYSIVESFKSSDGGKVVLSLRSEKIPTELCRVSRLKASEFRKWIKRT
ncbi:MAG: LytTR family transcriptional regulator DNA-binding domain-containing protein [Ekhidna sp.]